MDEMPMIDPPCGVCFCIWLATATPFSVSICYGWKTEPKVVPCVTKKEPSKLTCRVLSHTACGMVKNSANGHIPALLTRTSSNLDESTATGQITMKSYLSARRQLHRLRQSSRKYNQPSHCGDCEVKEAKDLPLKPSPSHQYLPG